MRKILLALLVLFSANALAVGPLSVSKSGPGKYFQRKNLKSNLSITSSVAAVEATDLRHSGLIAGKSYRYTVCMYYVLSGNVATHTYVIWGPAGGTNHAYHRFDLLNGAPCFTGTFVANDSTLKVYYAASTTGNLIYNDANQPPTGYSSSSMTTYSIVEEI